MLRRWRAWRESRQRALFEYWDGCRQRRADPFLTWRRLFADPAVNLLDLLPLADQGKEPETTQVIEFLCRAFGVERYDERTGQGLTDWEVLRLLSQFHQYLEALKKNTSPGPTSSPPTAQESFGNPAHPSAATSGPWDCGSTPAASIPAGPSASSAESAPA